MPSKRGDLARRAQVMFAGELGEDVRRQVKSRRARRARMLESIWTAYEGDEFYEELGVGALHGLPTVTWFHADRFIYRPDVANPLRYVTASGREIVPQVMETDGGSIPQLLRGFKKLSQWGYAPAFLIHDWLFVAKKCGVAPDNDWAFEDTAWIMAEVMKTMTERGVTDMLGQTQKMPKQEDIIYLMYLAVMSGPARRVWDDADSFDRGAQEKLMAAAASA